MQKKNGENTYHSGCSFLWFTFSTKPGSCRNLNYAVARCRVKETNRGMLKRIFLTVEQIHNDWPATSLKEKSGLHVPWWTATLQPWPSQYTRGFSAQPRSSEQTQQPPTISFILMKIIINRGLFARQITRNMRESPPFRRRKSPNPGY